MISNFIYVLPKDKAFMCRQCGKEPQFVYKFPSSKSGVSKICCGCVVKAMDKVNLEMDLAEELATR